MCLQGRWRGQSMSSGKYKNKLSYRKHFFLKKKKKPLTSVVEFTSMYGLKEVEGK
jgi:hypothetical protein